ncbi:MAG: hypothetical protein R3Y63_06260 [Eubacteriales bacterium]
MYQDDFKEEEIDYDKPFVQKVDQQQWNHQGNLDKGMWIMRIIVGYYILLALVQGAMGINRLGNTIQIVLLIFLYRGALWIRILMGVGSFFNIFTLYLLYQVLFIAFGMGFALIVLPFLLGAIAMPLLLFFYPPVVDFLSEQRSNNF